MSCWYFFACAVKSSEQAKHVDGYAMPTLVDFAKMLSNSRVMAGSPVYTALAWTLLKTKTPSSEAAASTSV